MPIVSEKKTKYRYWLTFFLEEFPTGYSFKPGLLHITVIPWFVIDGEEQELVDSFHKFFAKAKSFDVRVGLRTQLGSKKDVYVNLVGAPQLTAIHQIALNWFEQTGARWAVKLPHVAKEYKPHIRRRQVTRLASGKSLRIKSLALVRARRQEDNVREIAAKVKFNE